MSDKPASPAELLKRAKESGGLATDDDEEAPKIFSDELYDDMRRCLLLLERRVKDGPGSVNADEVTDFEAATDRILGDMNERAANFARPASAAAPVASLSPPPPASEFGDGVFGVTDMSLDEGPAYDGTGGMGQARGTRNTYVIPGMDEMTAEEYQKELQRSVIARQEERRVATRGIIGNRASHSYLDQLGWGGASASLAGENIVAKEEETAPPTPAAPTSWADKTSGASPIKPWAGKRDSVEPPAPVQEQVQLEPERVYDPVVNHGGRSVTSPFDQPQSSEARSEVVDTSNDESPAYDGTGGLGMARGTRNTYVIPGMDEMTAEEYQVALQKSVSDLQEERRMARSGAVGNGAVRNYLDSL